MIEYRQRRNLRQWRVIYDTPTTGALNMAIDEAILISVSARAAPPTLRLYAWNPPCLSLGYGQHAREADLSRLPTLGWDIVRRLTGGRAILHADELTYSLALPGDHSLTHRGIVESYRQISQALLIALNQLGAQPHADRLEASSAKPSSPICFDTPSHYEITVNGCKLVGSAQVRRREGLLQHGTLPLDGDLTRICDALVFSDEAARSAARTDVRARALTLAEALGITVDWQEAAEAVVEGFVEAFDIDFEQGGLSPDECAQAERLAQEVYGNPDWTLRR